MSWAPGNGPTNGGRGTGTEGNGGGRPDLDTDAELLPETRESVAVLGAGLAGPLMAAYLGRAGYAVDVYERRRDPRTVPPRGGRSVNLAMSVRGMHALEEIGALEEVRALAIPMRGRMMHAVSGELTFQPYGTEDDQVLYSISRDKLNELVVDRAEAHANVRFHFEHEALDVDLENVAPTFLLESGEMRSSRHLALIGADGAYSALRWAMQRRWRFDFHQEYLDYGYKELSISPKTGEEFALDPHALHIWPRSTYMLIALPNTDGTHTCTLFFPHDGAESFATTKTREEIEAFFARSFPDVPPLMPDYVEQFQSNPVGALVTVRCDPYHHGRNVLIGDAAHAVVPFYGQGMNAAFEDCTLLGRILEDHPGDWETAFERFSGERRADANALADLALDNFVEMRNKVGSRLFLLRKARERVLHRVFPTLFLPLYTMITFTRIPYADARRRAAAQDRVVGAVSWILLSIVIMLLLAWLA